MTGGVPDIDATATPYKGYVLCDTLGSWGAYLVSASGAQLTAINALPAVVGIVAVTENGVKWAELDGTIAAGVRTNINNWLTNRGITNIPSGWSYRQVINAIYNRFNNRFDINSMDITN